MSDSDIINTWDNLAAAEGMDDMNMDQEMSHGSLTQYQTLNAQSNYYKDSVNQGHSADALIKVTFDNFFRALESISRY